MDGDSQDRSVQQTRQLRAMAARVLKELIENRNRCEHHLAELGRADAIKSITGCSSMDEVVKRTRKMIDQMDAVLESTGTPGGEPSSSRSVLIETATRRQPLQPVHSTP